MNSPFFSVIIPAFNAEKHIEKGLQSIASQSFTDYELIVVCDSCRDRTEEIAKAYGAMTIPVEYGSDGLSRDKGIQAASGEWVMFMDDDDWYLHEYCFQLLADKVGQRDEDMLAFSYIWKGRGYIRQTNESLFMPNQAHIWSKCWRRAAIRDAYFGNHRFVSDTYFLKRMRKNIRRAVIWDMPIYYYNFMREGSQSDLLVKGDIVMSPIAKEKG